MSLCARKAAGNLGAILMSFSIDGSKLIDTVLVIGQ